MAAPARVSREWTAWVLFGVACVIGLALAAGVYQRGAPARDTNPFRFLVSVPPMPNPLDIAVSPDGRQIAFVASTSEGRTALFVRQSASLELAAARGNRRSHTAILVPRQPLYRVRGRRHPEESGYLGWASTERMQSLFHIFLVALGTAKGPLSSPPEAGCIACPQQAGNRLR